MKTRLTIDLKVKMTTGISGATGCVGYFPEGTTFEDLSSVFGQPVLFEGDSSMDKVQVEWSGTINGIVFTIYDYKSKVGFYRNTDWHIGGRINFVAQLVNAYFAQAMKNNKKSKCAA